MSTRGKKRKREEQDVAVSEDDRKKFMKMTPRNGPCPWPGCNLIIKSHPEAHWRVHTQEKPYKCDFENCNQAFSTSSSLKRHRRIKHLKEKPYKCDFENCTQTFSTANNLKVHERTHTGEKSFKCNFENCTQAFATSSYLTVHERIHIGSRPYKCNFENCTQAFVDSSSLKVHERSHTGSKPYQCDFENCTQAFATSSARTKHMRTHTGSKPYQCDFENCAQAFSTSSSLRRHQRIHTGEKEHKCDFPGCDYATARTDRLNDHFWRMHTEEGKARHKAREDRMYKDFITHGVTIDARCQRISFSCMGGTWAEPDFTIQKSKHIVFAECDEDQHKDRILACLLARVTNLQTSQIISGETRPIVFLWINPDKYSVDGLPGKLSYDDRIKASVNIIENFVPDQPLTIYKVGYDMTTDLETGEKYPCIFDDPDYDEALKPFVKWIY